MWLHSVLVHLLVDCGVIPVVMIAAHHFSLAMLHWYAVIVTSFDFTVNIFFSWVSCVFIVGGHEILTHT